LSFRQVNYIFHKLLGNTKHVKFWLRITPWWSFVQNEIKVHFSCTFWGAPHVAEIAQGLKGMVLRKKFVLPIESWFFTSFHFFFLLMVLYDVIFNVTATICMWSFWFFSIYKFIVNLMYGMVNLYTNSCVWRVLMSMPLIKNILKSRKV
jgi:hypothetical protein